MCVDLDAWDAWSPEGLSARLGSVNFRWAVAGGWALDLFTGSAIRVHDDLEVVIARESFAAIQRALPELRWFAAGDGTVTPLADEPDAQLGRTWQTWGWDVPAGCWRIDVMREPWTAQEWVYRCSPTIRCGLDKAIKTSVSGVPYLLPEIVLLFKAKHLRVKDQADFSAAVPLLSSAQRKWLASAVAEEQPTHPWLSQLGQ